MGVLWTFEVLLGAQWLTTDAWLLLPGARISHCFCSKETVFIEGSGCGSDRHLWLEQSGGTFQDYHGRTGEMQGWGRGYIKSGSEVMKHNWTLGSFFFVKKPKWNKHWTNRGRDSQTVPLSNKLRTLPVRTCMSQRMKRERRGVRCFFLSCPQLAPLTSWNFEAFPEVKCDEMRFCSVSGRSSIPHAGQPVVTLALRSTSWRKYAEILDYILVLYPPKTMDGFRNTVKFGGIIWFLIWLWLQETFRLPIQKFVVRWSEDIN